MTLNKIYETTNLKYLDFDGKRLYVNEVNGKWKFLNLNSINDKSNPFNKNIINRLEISSFFCNDVKQAAPANNKHIILKVTDDCNLRCSYCFQGIDKPKNNLTFEGNSEIIKLLESYAKEHKNMTYSIEFTGGEPLLFPEIIDDFIIKANNSKLTILNYALKTNGTIYSKKIDNMIKNNNIGLCLSIDGDAPWHDKNRLSRNGGSTFDLIRKNINKYNYPFTNIAVAYSPNQFEGIFNLFDIKLLIGQRINPIIFDKSYKEIDQKLLARNQFKLYKKVINHYDTNGTFNLIVSILELYSRILNPVGITHFDRVCPSRNCNAAFRMISIDPLLDIYPCMEISNHSLSKTGNVQDQDIIDLLFSGSKINYVKKMNNINIEKCNDCIFRIFCRGGCPSRSFSRYGNFDDISDSCTYTYELHKLAFLQLSNEEDTKRVIAYLKNCLYKNKYKPNQT